MADKMRRFTKDWDDFYRSQYITGEDCKDKLHIKIVELFETELKPEESDDGEAVLVAKVEGFERMWKLNRTNAMCLKAMFGSARNAIGKRVTLYARKEKAFGEEHLTVRIYGSADIEKTLKVTVKQGQRKVTYEILAPRAQGQAAPPPKREEPPAQQPATREPGQEG